MLIEQTVDKLNALKLGAMADAFQKQLDTDQAAALSFEERLGLLVDTEWTAVDSANCSLKSRSTRNRRPARKLRLKYFTPDSTFPFVWARYTRHSRGSKPQKSANALNDVFHRTPSAPRGTHTVRGQS